MSERPTPRTIGLLGGMGPEATVLMMQRLIEATPATLDADHIPLLVDSNSQVPSRIDHLIHGTGQDPGPVLAAMAERLQDMGADALIMPCNTAHLYAPVITEDCRIPLISMVDAVADEIADAMPAGARVGMLASPAVRLTRLFEPAFEARGLVAVYAPDDTPLLRMIQLIKAEGATPDALAGLASVASSMLMDGAECLVIACSEFSLLGRDLNLAAPCFDSIDAVCRATLSFALPPRKPGSA